MSQGETTSVPSVSVIVPARNAERSIERQLRAIAAQTSSETWELIVVDDCSDRPLAPFIRSLDCGVPIRVVRAEIHQGRSGARNIGARSAVGDVLLFCDADDEVQPGWLDAMASILVDHDFVGATFDVERLNDPETVAGRSMPQQTTLPSYLGRPYSAGGGLGVRRDMWERVGGMDARFDCGEDAEVCFRMDDAGAVSALAHRACVAVEFREDIRAAFRQNVVGGRHDRLLVRLYGTPADQREWWTSLATETCRAPLSLLLQLRPGISRGRRFGAVRRLGKVVGRWVGLVAPGRGRRRSHGPPALTDSIDVPVTESLVGQGPLPRRGGQAPFRGQPSTS
jgi:GT2 family glycosyltransferase